MLTTLEVNELVYNWYNKLDVHAPVEELLPMLISTGPEMRLPEVTTKTTDAFREWYKKVTNLFFDEAHTMKMLDIVCDGETAAVTLVVNWQASVWTPPAAKSKWIGFNAAQSWNVRRDPKTGKAVIAIYSVDKFEPMEGSAAL